MRLTFAYELVSLSQNFAHQDADVPVQSDRLRDRESCHLHDHVLSGIREPQLPLVNNLLGRAVRLKTEVKRRCHVLTAQQQAVLALACHNLLASQAGCSCWLQHCLQLQTWFEFLLHC